MRHSPLFSTFSINWTGTNFPSWIFIALLLSAVHERKPVSLRQLWRLRCVISPLISRKCFIQVSFRELLLGSSESAFRQEQRKCKLQIAKRVAKMPLGWTLVHPHALLPFRRVPLFQPREQTFHPPLDRLLKLGALLARHLYSIVRAWSRFVDHVTIGREFFKSSRRLKTEPFDRAYRYTYIHTHTHTHARVSIPPDSLPSAIWYPARVTRRRRSRSIARPAINNERNWQDNRNITQRGYDTCDRSPANTTVPASIGAVLPLHVSVSAFKAHASSFVLARKMYDVLTALPPLACHRSWNTRASERGMLRASETIFREPFTFLCHHRLVGLVVTTSTRDCRPSWNRAPPSGWLHGVVIAADIPAFDIPAHDFRYTATTTLLSTTLPPFALWLPTLS